MTIYLPIELSFIYFIPLLYARYCSQHLGDTLVNKTEDPCPHGAYSLAKGEKGSDQKQHIQ